MNDQVFKDLVAQEVKGKATADQQSYLALPENIAKWEDSLMELIDSLDEQINSNRTAMAKDSALYEALGDDGLKLKVESEIAYNEQCRKIARFRHHVEKRLNHVARIRATQTSSTEEHKAKVADFLRLGIERYLEVTEDISRHEDEHLRRLLLGEWTFDA